jgi:putative methionine-R-sulfoxide reductase with GAF domain
MRAKVSVEVPELADFDQDEINNNPIFQAPARVPPIGALLVEKGLITREQIDACLLVQAQDHPDMQLGQILVYCGYISERALEQALDIQTDLKATANDANAARALPAPDLTALILHRRGDDLADGVLSRLGVAARVARDWAELKVAWAEQRPDLIVIDGALLDDTSVLPDQATTPTLLLPPILSTLNQPFHAPQWARTIISRFVGQVRIQKRQQDAIEQLRERDFELSAVAAASRSMTGARSSYDAIMHLMSTIRDLFGVEAGTLYHFDRAAQHLIFKVVLGPHQETLYRQRLPIDRGIAGWVVRNGEPLLIPDVRRDPRFEGMFDHQSGFQTRSVLCVPLIVKGELYGVIQLINKLNGQFNERDLLLLRILAGMGALAEATDTWLCERDLAR